MPVFARKAAIIVILVLLGVSYGGSVLLDRYLLSLFISVLVYVTLVAAWNIISGYTGYLFLGAAAFYGLGAYVVPWTSGLLPYLAAIPVAGALCFAAAFLIGVPFLRIRGPYFIIATFALGQLISNVILYYEVVFTRTVGRWIALQDLELIYINMVTIAFGTVIAAYFVKNSRFGYGLLSIKGDEEAAEASGVPTTMHKLFAFGLCAFFMGLAGAASVPRFGYADNTIAFSSTVSFNTLIIASLGGSGNVVGGTISAILLTLVFELFFSAAEPYPFLVLMGALIFLVVFYGGRLAQLRDRLKRSLRPEFMSRRYGGLGGS